MKTWLVYLWDALRDKLWFIPSLCCIAGIACALLCIYIDHHLPAGFRWRFLNTTGASARIVLGALIGAQVTVVGLAFSLTMLSVSQTASQYGPRLIRSVFDSNAAQLTLGLFLGTIAFNLVVLRSIRDFDAAGSLFTPHISVLIAELVAAACIFSLLFFTNKLTQCMRAETLIESIYNDLLATTDRLFPHPPDSKKPPATEGRSSWPLTITLDGKVESPEEGYLQAVNLTHLIAVATKQECLVKLEVKPGDFVVRGELLALFHCSAPKACETALSCELASCFLLGPTRTPRQDIEAAMMELVEAGVRALSPGINDPTTAINVVDYLSSFFVELAQREFPDEVLLDEEREPRIQFQQTSFTDVLDAGFNQLRQYAGNSVAVYCRILEALTRVASVAKHESQRDGILAHVRMVDRQVQEVISEELDLQSVAKRISKIEQILHGPIAGDANKVTGNSQAD